ncbi:hypothetical protein AXE65_00460 [Ventosimonas gracilis]|uniref:UPF0235 protein AXE65_00460 n=1 Tax=Ventosimonas gracilis TaxID=1680762 RepID=A0A139STZ7_9GAMM|nr:DUF167 family protein [Ventosimonas gracilis]KXU38025.1 hypothetical protein AXE65_00460 [Ventosimonas gracilis]
MTDFFRWDGGDLILFCHLQPAAKTNGFAGLHGDRLKIRLRAPALEGRANAALIDFLSEAFAVSKVDIELESGSQSRQKRVRIKSPERLPELAGLSRLDP